MPITGRFNADFGNFIDAIQGANVKIADMGKVASGVEAKLNSMVDNFSGRKIIQDATLMATALEFAGGTSLLTAKQLEQVSQQAQAAADKMTALGYSVPPGIQKLADAIDDAKSRTGGWIPIIQSLGESWVARIAEGVLLRDAIRGVIGQIEGMAAALPQLALKGAAISDVSDNFQHLTEQAGILGNVLLGQLKTGTHNTIDDFELMKAVNKDLGAGMVLSNDQFRLLADGAFALAQSTGIGVKEAFDKMNDAMLTGRTRGLAELTGKIDLHAAEEKYAKSIGTTADRLNDAGKLEAQRAGILDAVAASTKRLGDQTDGLDEKVDQARTVWANLTNELGKTLATSNVLMGAIDGVGKILTEAFGGSQKTAIDGITKAVDELTIQFVSAGSAGVEAAGFIEKEWIAAKKVMGDLNQVVDGVRLAYLLVREAAAFKYDPVTHQISEDYKKLDDTIAHLEETMKARGDQLQADSKAQADVDERTVKYTQTLDGLVGKLRAVQAASRTVVDENLNIFGGLTTVTGAVDRQTGSLTKGAKGTDDFAKAWKELDSIGGSFQKTIDGIDGSVVEAIEYYLKAGASVGTLAKAYGLTDLQVKAIDESIKLSTKSLEENLVQVHAFESEGVAAANAVAKGFAGMPNVLKNLGIAMGDIQISGKQFLGVMGLMPDLSVQAAQHIRNLTTTIGDGLNQALQKVPGLLANAFTGGGGLLGGVEAIGTTIGSTLGTTIGKGISVLGKLGGPIGSAIGSLVGPLIGAIANLGGPSQQELDGRKLEAQFEAAAGGFQGMMDAVGKAYAATGHSSQEAQADVKALLDAERQGPEATQKWIDKIQGIETAAAGLGDLSKTLADNLGGALKVPADALASYDTLNQKQLDLRTQIDAASGDQRAKLEAQLADVQKQLAQAGALYNATIPRTQAQAAALADSVVGDFGAMIKNGVSFTDAIGKIGPSVTELSSIFGGMGDVVQDTTTLGGAAFDHLKGLVGLASDAIAGPAINSVQGLSKSMAALDQLGLGNKADFEGLGDQIGATFQSLIDQGKDGNDLLIAMRDPIQQLWEEQEKFGLKLDDSTQKIVDQAVQQGIVGPQMEDVNKQLLKVMKDIDDTLKAMSGHANDFGNAVTNLPSSKTVDIKTVYTSEGSPAGDGATGAWSGGIVGPYGVQHAAFGGNVVAFPGQPQGLDRIPVWTARGEGIVSQQGMGTIGAEGLAAINSGKAIGGGGTTVVDTSRQAAETAALRQDFADLVSHLPRLMRDAVQLAPRAA